MLKTDFGLTMTEAAVQLGYANATTLHKIRRGAALPDPARLAAFAERQRILGSRTMNLHWVWTGLGSRLIDRSHGDAAQGSECSKDIDFINTVVCLKPKIKQALLVLLAKH